MSFKIEKSYEVGKVSFTAELEPDESMNGSWFKLVTAEIVSPTLHIYFSKPAGMVMVEAKGDNELSLTYKGELNTISVPDNVVEDIKNGSLTRLFKEIRYEIPLDEDVLDSIEEMLWALESLLKVQL
jgi:hypothetical protein